MDFIQNYSYNKMIKDLENEGIATPPDLDPIELPEDAILNFIAWGDPQVSSVAPHRAANFTAGCRDLKNMKGKLDAIVLLGDVAEFGRECEYKLASEILNDVGDKFDKFFAVTGNHDIRLRNHKKQMAKFNSFIRSVDGGVVGSDEHYYFSYEIKGCKFIFMGSDYTALEGEFLSREQLKMVDREITDAEKRNMPVFVFNHQTLRDTNGLPEVWTGRPNTRGSVGFQSDSVLHIFEKHKNTIFVTGHLHYGVCRINYEDCGCFKALSVPTIGATNHGTADMPAQGYIISVFEDRIEIRARIHSQGRYFEEGHVNSFITIKR